MLLKIIYIIKNILNFHVRIKFIQKGSIGNITVCINQFYINH